MSQYIFILVWIAAMFFLKSVMSGGYRVENILGNDFCVRGSKTSFY